MDGYFRVSTRVFRYRNPGGREICEGQLLTRDRSITDSACSSCSRIHSKRGGSPRSDAAGQVRIQRRSRTSLDPYAGRHVSDIPERIQGWVLDEYRLPVVVILVGEDGAPIPHPIHQLGQRRAHISKNILAAGRLQLLEEIIAFPVRQITGDGRVTLPLEAQVVSIDDKINIFGEPPNQIECFGQ